MPDGGDLNKGDDSERNQVAPARLDGGRRFKIAHDRHMLDRLTALRAPGESYIDVIFAAGEGGLVATLLCY